MLKNDTLENGTSSIGLYGSASPGGVTCLLQLTMDLFFNVGRQATGKIAPLNTSLLCVIHASSEKLRDKLQRGLYH